MPIIALAPLALLLLGGLVGPAQAQESFAQAPRRPLRLPVPHPTQPAPFPPASQRLQPDQLVHQDTTGGSEQVLLDLAGGEFGFAGLWRDTRDGNFGIYFSLIDRKGERVAYQRAIHEPSSARHTDPSIALGPDKVGGLVWFGRNPFRSQSLLRWCFTDNRVQGPILGIGAATGSEPESQGEPPAPNGPSRQPAIAFGADGSGALAWREGPGIYVQSFGSDLAFLGEPRWVNAGEPAADSHPRVARVGTTTAVAWGAGGQIFLDAGAGLQQVGGGVLQKLIADPLRSGFWVLALADKQLAFSFVSLNGRSTGSMKQPLALPLASVDMALYGKLLLIVTEELGRPDTRCRNGPMRLWLVEPSGLPVIAPLNLPNSEAVGAFGPRLAVSGLSVLVAWTDSRQGQPDVYCRFLRPGDFERPDLRWNDDDASADQGNPSLASDPSLRAVISWEDQRLGSNRIWGRLIAVDGRFLGPEFPINPTALDRDAADEVEPCSAMLRGGRFAVQWVESQSRRLLMRQFGADAKPVAEAFPVARATALATGRDHCLIAIESREGYARAWVDESGAIWLEGRDSLGGVLYGPQEIAPAPRKPNGLPSAPALAELTDGRLLAVWESEVATTGQGSAGPRGAPTGKKKVMQARLFGPEGEPRGAPFALPGMGIGGGDFQPRAVAAEEDGFLLVFTGNDGPVRNVYTQRFDRRAAPREAPVLISAEHNEQDYPVLVSLGERGTVVVFEDDLSGDDLIVARRLSGAGRLGPTVTVDELETRFVSSRTDPTAVGLGAGFVVAFEDRRRSQGADVYCAVFGAQFDRLEALKTAPSEDR